MLHVKGDLTYALTQNTATEVGITTNLRTEYVEAAGMW